MTEISEAWISVAMECPRFEYEIRKGRLTVDEVALRHQRGEYVHHMSPGDHTVVACMHGDAWRDRNVGWRWEKTAAQKAAEDAE